MTGTQKRTIRIVLAKMMHPHIYQLGQDEAEGTIGMTYRHSGTLKSVAYDTGREDASNA